MTKDASGVEEGAIIDFWFVGIVPKVEVSSCSASGFAGVEIASIAMNFKFHIAFVETKYWVGVCVTII